MPGSGEAPPEREKGSHRRGGRGRFSFPKDRGALRARFARSWVFSEENMIHVNLSSKLAMEGLKKADLARANPTAAAHRKGRARTCIQRLATDKQELYSSSSHDYDYDNDNDIIYYRYIILFPRGPDDLQPLRHGRRPPRRRRHRDLQGARRRRNNII